jgi:pimeloyl-ACP methyl ester carboxylesterase
MRRLALLAAVTSAAVAVAGCGAQRVGMRPAILPTTSAPAGQPKLVTALTATTQVAHTADGAVGYRELGSGPTLLLIMGFGGTLDSWQPSFVDALAATHTVVLLDNAGIGKTAALPAPLTITAMAQQTDALLRSLHLGRVDVLGWSMGGMIAQALTATHPGDVRRLVLAATLPGDGHATLPTAAVVATLSKAATSSTALLSLLFPDSTAGTAAATTYVGGIFSYPDQESPSAAALQQQGLALASWTGGKEPAGDHLGAITNPTLVADGSVDTLAPPANSRTLAATIPHATLHLYAGAAHAFLFQDESAFVPTVLSFLG